MSKQDDIFQKYLLQHFEIKLNNNTMVTIDQCPLEVFMLTIFEKIVQK